MENSIKSHIERNKRILDDSTISPQKRRHIQDELNQLESYLENNPNTHRNPSSLELYCDANPDADECRIYED